jgi:plastocyanin
MHRWWVFLHVVGVFGFLMAHGVSAYVTLRLPRERDPARISHLLELSASSVGFMWNSIGLLLLGGILAGFTGHFWGQAWIWAAIVVLAAVIAAMYAMGTTWAARLRTISGAMAGGTEAVTEEQLVGILRSKRPFTIAAIGFVGLLVILWLMIFKPTLGFGGTEATCSPSPDAAVTVCAFNDQSFSSDRLSAPAGEPFTLTFDNEDDGVPHNVAIYKDDSAVQSLFVGDLADGPRTVTYDVPALDPGTYYFRCDVHPQMSGSLVAA